MMQSRTAPCKKGEELAKDYEATANFLAACDNMLPRSSNPSYVDRLHVQAPAGSVITGKVVVSAESGKVDEGAVPMSAGVIAAVCIFGIVVLFICLLFSEIMSSLSWLRRRHSGSSGNGHNRAGAPEGSVESSNPNPSEAVISSNGSLAAATSAAASGSQAAGSKQGLAYWLIKGLSVIKCKKQKVQLHPRANVNPNSASSIEFINAGNIYQHSSMNMIGPAALDQDVESASQAYGIYTDGAAPDHDRLECVVCLSPYEEDEAVRVLPQCCHAFHVACIDSWLILHSTCPLCRVQISSLDAGNDGEAAGASFVIAWRNTPHPSM